MYDWSTENGGNINQWEYWGGDGQKFILEEAEMPEIKGLAGDVNCDEKVDLSDAVLIMQYLSNPAMYGVNGSVSLILQRLTQGFILYSQDRICHL